MSTGSEFIPVGDVDRRIEEIEALIRQLPIELAALKRLRRGAVLVDSPSERTIMGHRSIAVVNGGKLGARDAVLNYLRRNPRSRPAEVVALLEKHIHTAATDRKRLLNSTIYNLVKNGTLERDKQGHLTVSTDGRGCET